MSKQLSILIISLLALPKPSFANFGQHEKLRIVPHSVCGVELTLAERLNSNIQINPKIWGVNRASDLEYALAGDGSILNCVDSKSPLFRFVIFKPNQRIKYIVYVTFNSEYYGSNYPADMFDTYSEFQGE